MKMQWDEPRAAFASPRAFLEEAKRLIQEDRVAWLPGHQMGHDVTRVEAVQLVYWAKPEHVLPHWTVPGRWFVWNLDRANRKVGVSASVRTQPDGNVLCLTTAFSPKEWGS